MIQAERYIWREGCYKPNDIYGGRDATSQKSYMEGGMLQAER